VSRKKTARADDGWSQEISKSLEHTKGKGLENSDFHFSTSLLSPCLPPLGEDGLPLSRPMLQVLRYSIVYPTHPPHLGAVSLYYYTNIPCPVHSGCGSRTLLRLMAHGSWLIRIRLCCFLSFLSVMVRLGHVIDNTHVCLQTVGRNAICYSVTQKQAEVSSHRARWLQWQTKEKKLGLWLGDSIYLSKVI